MVNKIITLHRGIITTFLCLVFSIGMLKAQAPAPFGALPSERQLDWHELEFYMFVHFNINTFTDMEWGSGAESPDIFNPSDLDCMQWAKIAKEAGMKGIIITAKHHDGFCLWPSKYSEHTVKNSPWKNGKGDVIQELREACDAYGLKMGIYYSPWDRNHADYGSEKYITYFHNQLTELLTQYGDIFEVWFDGANGGDGYYGGANETRKVDRKTYYNFPEIWNLVRRLQPNAVMFSDGGPDVRWIGNEHGTAGRTNWSTLNRDLVWPGWPYAEQLPSGHKRGSHWVAGEVDVSIRPGWYYHASEDHKVHSLPRLLDIYYESIGRNASFLLNIPVDRRGKVHEKDSMQLMALSNQLKKDFANNLLEGSNATSSTVRLNSPTFSADKTIDGDPQTYWATDDFTRSGSITYDLGSPQYFNRFLVQEYIALGQRIDSFTVDIKQGDQWINIAKESTIGYKRILRFNDVEARWIRLNIISTLAPPTISNVEIYRAPKVLNEITITRDQDDEVNIEAGDRDLEIYYTTDGSPVSTASNKYHGPFTFSQSGEIQAMAVDHISMVSSPVTRQWFSVSKKNWKIKGENIKDWKKSIDDNGFTTISLSKGRDLVLDLGQQHKINGFEYLPDQNRYGSGIVSKYRFKVSKDGIKWRTVAEGSFDNIKNNPIMQTISFKTIKGRYISFSPLATIKDGEVAKVAEIDVLIK